METSEFEREDAELQLISRRKEIERVFPNFQRYGEFSEDDSVRRKTRKRDVDYVSALSMDIERIVKKCEKIRPHLAALFAPSENDIPALQAQWQVNASYIAALQKDASSAIRRKLVKAVNEIRTM